MAIVGHRTEACIAATTLPMSSGCAWKLGELKAWAIGQQKPTTAGGRERAALQEADVIRLYHPTLTAARNIMGRHRARQRGFLEGIMRRDGRVVDGGGLENH